MIEAAAPAGTITQAFSWPPPPQARSARLFGAAPTYAPTQPPGRGDGDRKRSRQVIDRLRLVLHRPGRAPSVDQFPGVVDQAIGEELAPAPGRRAPLMPDHRGIRAGRHAVKGDAQASEGR